jgi:hypothetical protein
MFFLALINNFFYPLTYFSMDWFFKIMFDFFYFFLIILVINTLLPAMIQTKVVLLKTFIFYLFNAKTNISLQNKITYESDPKLQITIPLINYFHAILKFSIKSPKFFE